ncbi:MAG TPA: hypothetical protein VFC77_07430 [Myxococcota bacterium]|nr:hypothetical protein [Myxococcota bacterium]
MEPGAHRARTVRLLEAFHPGEAAVDPIADDEGRVETGLSDALAMLELIAFLEAEFGSGL